MRLGISTAAFYGHFETEEAASFIGALPLECAEVFLQGPSEWERSFVRDVRARLGGVPCTSVHPLGTDFENGMFSRSARKRRDTLDIICRVLDAGVELGAGMYVYHGRFAPRHELCPWNLRANADVLALMCEEAEKRGMLIAWENVEWCQLTDESRVREARLAVPQVRYTLDIKQAMRAGRDPFEMARAMGDRLVNVHVCDWDERGKLCLPGEGAFDFTGFFALLRSLGYVGPVILEPYLALIKSGEALEGAIAHLRNAMSL